MEKLGNIVCHWSLWTAEKKWIADKKKANIASVFEIHQTKNSVCIYRTMNFILYSESIQRNVHTLLNEFTFLFFLYLCKDHLARLYRYAFLWALFGMNKNMLTFDGDKTFLFFCYLQYLMKVNEMDFHMKIVKFFFPVYVSFGYVSSQFDDVYKHFRSIFLFLVLECWIETIREYKFMVLTTIKFE